MPEQSKVGIVVVSHSAALATAAVRLAREMLHGDDVRIEVAAGLDEHTLGTDAIAILAALVAADTGAGVVVLMDLGSAILSTELAVDLLDDGARARVVLCAAPVVEGLVVAVVAAAGGADRDRVAAEAVASLAGKQAHLGVPADLGTPSDADPVTAGGASAGAPVPNTYEQVEATFVVLNPHGLHARPAARLVQEVAGLDAAVTLSNVTTGARPVPAGSLSQVATLGAREGHEVTVRATGPQAAEAVARLVALAARSFGEESHGPGRTAVAAPAEVRRQVLRPDRAGSSPSATTIPAAPGIGIGPLWSLGSAAAIEVTDARTDDPAAARAELGDAVEEVARAIAGQRNDAARDLGEHDAAIFDAHLLMLRDVALLDEAHRRIDGREAAAPAWAAAVHGVEQVFAQLEDPYLQARAADIRAVGDQVLRVLLRLPSPVAAGSGVLLAADITPAEVVALDANRVVAIVLTNGSPTAHCAILARAKGIPVVVGAGTALAGIADGTVVAVDGSTGEIVVAPTPAVLEDFRERATAAARSRASALGSAEAPAVTAGGRTILVGANLGSLDDALLAARSGADLAGLVRSEFLFLGRPDAPDVDEQQASYLALAEAIGGRRLTLRTLDVGGDKPLSYVPMPPETNPFLGVRGLRLSLARPALFADQLLAVVRTAHLTPVSVMFPMVSTVAELFAARRMLDDAIARDGRGHPDGLDVGIMVEVPAAALKAAAFAPHVDFFSIGTNDLTQYTLAAERGNGDVAALGDPFDPAVLRLISAVCDGAGDAMVGVCGELAADPGAAALLVGLGVDELSMSPLAIPLVKQAVRLVDDPEAQRIAKVALAADGPADVRALLHDIT